MVCPTCGARNPEDVKSCGQCGRGLPAVDDATVFLDSPPASSDPPPAPSSLNRPTYSSEAMTWGTLPSQPIAFPASLPPGTSFGRYRIDTLLGEGGMGAVYKAEDMELNRTVALKLVRPELATNPQTMQRFKQELLLASRISHKNILRIHDLGDWNGVKFITMAYVEGMDLAAVIEKTGRLPFERALKFTRQLCAALEAAHSEGVAHRDLKPQNILVDQADNLYVSDFGLAKSLEAEMSMGTRTGQILGTPRYMSPEQVEAREVDHRSDLYSAGLIIYEMFTGELPFRGDSAMQLMYQRVSEPPRDPRRACPDLPDYLANIILKCLEKDPAKRYQTAREILDDLDAQHTPQVSNAGGKTISIQIRKPTRRGTLIAAAAGATLAVALGLIPVTRNAILAMLPGASRTGQPAIEHYMAVLPLNTIGGDAGGLKYIAEGIGDSLTAKLSGLRNVYVADANAVAALPAAVRQDDFQLAKALGVTLLVKGTLTGSGNSIAVTILAEDVSKPQKRRLLSQEFPGVKRDLLTMQDDIFNGLAQALLIRQSDEEKARTTARPTQDVGAYDLYLRGRSVLRGKRDAATAQEAIALFDQATTIDRGFALAYTGLADASMRMFLVTKDRQWSERARGAAQQAEGLNRNLPEVHFSLGVIYSATGHTEEAIGELQQALRLAPNSDDGLRRLGLAYKNAGKLDQAAAAYAHAAQVNPYYWRNYDLLGGTYFRMGDNQKMLAAYQQVTRLDAGNARGWSGVGAAQYRLGDPNASIASVQKAIEIDPQPLYYSQLGTAYFFLGRYAEAARTFEAGIQKSPDDATLRQYLADAYRWLNQPEKATAAYNEAIRLANRDLNAAPKSTEALGVLSLSYAKINNRPLALQSIRQARQINPEDNDLMYKEATVYALAEQWPEAFSSLKAALKNGYSLSELNADPELKLLRERPEFEQLLKEAPKSSSK